jgi:hypothetical protein
MNSPSRDGSARIANRRLIPIEQSKEILNRRLGSSNVLVASRIRGPLTPELLRRALDLLQRRHPRLRSTIEGPDAELHFRDEQAGPIPMAVERSAGESADVGVELREINRPIDSRSCLLRATLLLPEASESPCRLILLAHHAAVDGSSLLELLEDLVRYCRRLHAGEPMQEGEVEPLALLPSAQDLMPAELKTWRGRIGTWVQGLRIRRRLRRFGARTLPVERLVPPRERVSGVVRRALGPDALGRLRARCVESGASMHGMLCAALLFAVALRLPAAESADGIPLICRTSVDLRQKLQPAVGRKDLGLFASFLLTYHRIGPDTTLESVASEVLEQLWLGYRNLDMFRGLQRVTKNTEAALRGRVPVTVFVTSVGESGIDVDHGAFRIEDVEGLPGGAAVPGVVGLANLTLNERLSLCFFFSRPALAESTVEGIADDVVDCLHRASQGEVRFGELARRA